MAMGSFLVYVQSHVIPSPRGGWLEGRSTRVTQSLERGEKTPCYAIDITCNLVEALTIEPHSPAVSWHCSTVSRYYDLNK